MRLTRRTLLLSAGAVPLQRKVESVDARGQASTTKAKATPPGAFEEQSIPQLQSSMAAGKLTATELVRHQLARIGSIDHSGPMLCSLSELSPKALEHAEALDRERAAGRVRGPLHGITISVKDLVDVQGLATTAGSLALLKNTAQADAPAVARLRAAGAVILAKANTAEWANVRSPYTLISWSAVGGYTRNPYALDRTAGGSSSGSGASVSAGLVTASLGEDTLGSIISPSNFNGLVGLRPTVGLIPRAGGIPFSVRQDTFGPMCRCVTDAAIMLTVMAGSDPDDLYSEEADRRKTDYASSLSSTGLRGVRLGIARFGLGGHPGTIALFEKSLQVLRDQGAVLVDIAHPPRSTQSHGRPGQRGESHYRYDAYLARTPPAVSVKSLADLVAFNREHAAQELALFGQEWLEEALAAPPLAPTPQSNRVADLRRQATREQVERLIREHSIEALVAPTGAPAGKLDVIVRNRVNPAADDLSLLGMSALAGFPLLTVPMGQFGGLPVGISLLGVAWSESRLLNFGYAFEHAAQARRPPRFVPSIETTAEYLAKLRPQRI